MLGLERQGYVRRIREEFPYKAEKQDDQSLNDPLQQMSPIKTVSMTELKIKS
jgi:hypothetical protein